MNFEQIIKFLDESLGVTYLLFSGKTHISKLLFLDPNAQEHLTDAIYVTFDDNFSELSALPQNVIMVYRTEQGKRNLSILLERNNINAILVHQSNYIKVVNFIQEILINSQSRSDSYAHFLRMIVNGYDLSYILNEAANQCQKQLIVVDFSGKIIAYSRSKGFVDNQWEMYIKDGYCAVSFMQHCYETFLQRTEISTKPYLYRCKDTGTVYLSSPILLNNYPHGYVFMISETTDIGTQAYEILPTMSKVAADFIQRNSPTLNSSAQMYRSLISDILLGESPDSVKSRLTASGLKVPKAMRVLIVRPYYQNSIEQLKLLMSQLSMVFVSVPPIRYENSIVLIQDMDPNKTEQIDKAISYLSELATSNHLLVGISNNFNDIQFLAQYYCQADDAMKLAARLRLKDAVVTYKDMSFYSLLSKLSVGEHMREFCHPALAELRAYDAENNSELYETLRTFTETNFNQKLTAERLFTHRNTIAYRKQQITELTGIDFTDHEEMFQLTYSFKIVRYFEP